MDYEHNKMKYTCTTCRL